MDEIKTTMSGKEYLQYLKYKDEKNQKYNKAIGKHFKTFSWHYVVLFVCFSAIFALYNILTYTEPVKATAEQTIFGMLIWLVLALGLSWIIHGVGFVLVKR